MIRSHCQKIKERGASVPAVRTRDIIGMVFNFAIARGIKCSNPAELIAPSTIAKFTPRDRALTKKEIGIFFNALKVSKASISLKNAVKIIFLTMVRKSCMTGAKWDEVDFKTAEWTIPAERMKASRKGVGRPHVVYLSEQVLDLFMQLHILAGGSKYVLPSFGQSEYGTVSGSSINRVATHAYELVRSKGVDIEKFTIHDFRRTASTHLHEMGYNSDWIEKSLAHEQRGVRAVYNKAEYAEQRRKLLQDWANIVDNWTDEFTF